MKKLALSFSPSNDWRTLEERKELTSHKWRKLRKKILLRDNYTCKYCGHKAEKYQFIHHINHDHSDNGEENLEVVCQYCNYIHHSGLGCVVRKVVDLYEKSNYSQNEIMVITREMREKKYSDKEIIKFLGLKKKVSFETDSEYLKKLYGFVTSRKPDYSQ